MNNLYILSAPVQTGKTTRLREWVKGKSNIEGILQPVINGKRHIIDIKSNETRQLCVDNRNNPGTVIQVGKFSFDIKVFEWANAELINALENRPEWLVVDEVGKLELKGEGLDSAVCELINKSKEYPVTKLLFVVRDSLCQSFFEYYNLNKDDVSIFEFTEE